MAYLKNKILKFTVFFIILIASNVFSQIEITRNITIDDGLAYSEVTCAYKDSRGIIWFGTSAGLSEWNGVDFNNYFISDGLPSSFVKSICEYNNKLYVATDKGLVVKGKNQFVFSKNLPDELKSQINEIYLSRNGVFYILSEDFGLWKKEDNVFKKIVSNEKTMIPITILERENGKVLIGTRTNGVYELDGDSLKQIIINEYFRQYPVVDMVELNKDTLCIALQGYGLVINSSSEKFKSKNSYFTVKNGLPSKNINDLELTGNNQLYIATANGIAIFKHFKIIKKITQSNGLFNEFILKIFPIRKDTFFFLSQGNGVFVYAENSFITYNKASGLLHDNVWRIKELQNGSMCFLTDEGISLLKGNKFSYITTENGLGDNLVVTLYEARNGDLYIGTYSDGINIISNNKIKRLNKKFGMFDNTVSTILKYKEDRIFFISRRRGIAVFDGKKIIDTLKINEELPNNDILSSFKKRDGTILIGVENEGLYKYDGKKFIPYFNEKENCSFWAIYEDEIGNLYLGSNGKGLFRCTPEGKRDTINVKKGLSNNTVVAIVSDNNGNIYAGTDKGLNIIKYLENGKSKVRQLYEQSGLANSECNQGALYKDKQGYIWVGTIGGATRINSNKMDNPQLLTHIVISSVKIMDKIITSVDSLNNLTLDYDRNDISIKFAGLNYCDPKIVKYRHKLESNDKKWIVDKRNEVRYANLAPGKYRFLVSASNAWGVWSEPIEISFQINKPFWETWWFLLIIIISISSIIVFINNYRVNRLLEIERLRTKIASDLHDEVGSLLTQISISANLINYDSEIDKIKNRGNLIRSKSKEIMSTMSDVIWSIDARNDKLEDLIDRMQDFASTLLNEKEIVLHFNKSIANPKKELKIDFRQNVFLIFKEAINNSVKHCDCSEINVNVAYNLKIFKMKISDNGKGLDLTKEHKGNGIKNMKMRAEKIKAKIEFENKNGLTIKFQSNLI